MNVTHILLNPHSVQLGELLGLLIIFEFCHSETINVFSDSQYAVQAVQTLSFYIKEQNKPIYILVMSLQGVLENRAKPWFISYIRSHSRLQGMMAKVMQ